MAKPTDAEFSAQGAKGDDPGPPGALGPVDASGIVGIYTTTQGLPASSSAYKGKTALLHYIDAVPDWYEFYDCRDDGTGTLVWVPSFL